MRSEKILAVLLLLALSFSVVGGCDNGNEGGNGDGAESPEPMTGAFDLETAIDLGELSLVAYN